MPSDGRFLITSHGILCPGRDPRYTCSYLPEGDGLKWCFNLSLEKGKEDMFQVSMPFRECKFSLLLSPRFTLLMQLSLVHQEVFSLIPKLCTIWCAITYRRAILVFNKCHSSSIQPNGWITSRFVLGLGQIISLRLMVSMEMRKKGMVKARMIRSRRMRLRWRLLPTSALVR